MRAIKKTVKVRNVLVVYYDRVKREEVRTTVVLTELEKTPPLLSYQVLIEEAVLEEQEVEFTLSPEAFMKYAEHPSYEFNTPEYVDTDSIYL